VGENGWQNINKGKTGRAGNMYKKRGRRSRNSRGRRENEKLDLNLDKNVLIHNKREQNWNDF
jgi:hypothetical protein